MSYFTRNHPQPVERVAKDSQASLKAWLKRQRAHRIARGDVSLADYAAKHDRMDVTVDEVLAHFPPEVKTEIAEKVAAATKEVRSFEDPRFTTAPWKFTEERQAKHQDIIDSILTPEAIKRATPAPGEKPSFIVLGGRGGSGKSKFTDGTINEFNARKHVVLDSDAIKLKLKPPYSGWNAFSVHEESSLVMEMLHAKAVALGLNIVHDVTLRSKSVEPVIDDLKARGYSVEGHYMHLSPENAAGRAISRYLGKGKDARGRLVPPEVVLGNKDNERNFDELKAKFDRWSAYDNSGPSGTMPKLIGKGSKESGK